MCNPAGQQHVGMRIHASALAAAGTPSPPGGVGTRCPFDEPEAEQEWHVEEDGDDGSVCVSGRVSQEESACLVAWKE